MTPTDYNIDSMFEKLTIPEVEQKLVKIKSDIEKKKEDLRIMVG